MVDVLRVSERRQPVTNLLLLRSKSSFPLPSDLEWIRADPIFVSLPVFKMKQISTFNEALQRGGSLRECLNALQFRKEYDVRFVESLFVASHERRKIGPAEQLGFLYDCLALVVSPTVDLVFCKKMDMVMKVLNQICDSRFCSAFEAIVHQLIETVLEAGQLDEVDISLLLMHFVVNKMLGEAMAQDLVRVCVELLNRNAELLRENMAMIALMFQQDLPATHVVDYRLFLACFAKYFTQLNDNALLIYAHASTRSSDSIIANSFALLPSILFAWICRSEVSQSDELKVFANSREFTMMKEGDFRQSCNIDLVNMASQFATVLRYVSDDIMSVFIEACREFDLSNSDLCHCIAYYKVIILVLAAICVKTDVSSVVLMLAQSVVFRDDETVFSENGVSNTINIVRNGVFDLLERTEFSILDRFLASISVSPFVMAESVLRAMYMFGRGPLLTPGIAESVLIAIDWLRQGSGNEESRENARSVLLSALINILSDSQMSLECFSNGDFSASFLSLIFDSQLTQSVIDSLANILSHFETLPNSIMSFLASVLTVCTAKHALGDFQILGLSLMKGIRNALTHNPRIGKGFLGVFEKALGFVKSTNTNEGLEIAISILTLVVQDTKKLDLSDDDCRVLLEIIDSTYGHEPSTEFLRYWLNILNASTSINPDVMFSIEVAKALPILICAYGQSTQLCYILDFIQKLLDYSRQNVLACHQGRVDWLLLKALGGEFYFMQKTIKFSMGDKEIDAALRVVATIVSDITSVEVDQLFIDLLTNEQSMQISKKALETLYEIFCIGENQCKTDIWSPEPIYSVKSLSGRKISRGFAFSFFMRLGSRESLTANDCFTIMRVTDSSHRVLRLMYYQDSLVLRYREGQGQISAVTSGIVPNKWVLVTCFLANVPGGRIVCYRIGNEYGSEIKFREIELDDDVRIELAMTEHTVFGPDRFSPISIGRFAMFFPPYEIEDFDQMVGNRMKEIPAHLNVGFAWNSPNCTKNVVTCKEDVSIFSVMPHHLKMSDITKLFVNQSCFASQEATEMVLKTFIRCTNFSGICTSGRAHVALIQDDAGEFTFLTKRINITSDVFREFNSSSSPYKFFMHLSEISEIVSHILHSSKARIDASLFSTFIEMLNVANDEEFQLEILENVILNIWAWITDDNVQYKKIVTQMRNCLGLCKIPRKSRLFEQFLVQVHILLRYSDTSFPSLQADMLKILDLLPLETDELPSLMAIMMSTEDNDLLIRLIDLVVRKDCGLPSAFVMMLTDLTARNCQPLNEKVLEVVRLSLKDPIRSRQCFSQMALNCDLTKCGLGDNFEVCCWATLKGQMTIADLMTLADKSSFEQVPLWWLAPVLVAVYVDECMMEYVTKCVKHCPLDGIVDQFAKIINFLSVILSRNDSDKTGAIINKFVRDILDYVIGNSQKIPRNSLRHFVYRTFVVCYYRLKGNSNTKALVNAWMESPFNDSVVLPKEHVHDKIHGSGFNSESLHKLIYTDLTGIRFVYRKSKSKSVDMGIQERIVKLIESTSGFESDEMCRLVYEFLSKKQSLLRTNNIFQYFSSGEESVQDVTRQVSLLMDEIRAFLDPKAEYSFDQKRILADVYNTERVRFKRIYNYIDREELATHVLSPRFLLFPFSTMKKLRWNVNDNDEFRLVYEPSTTETLTVLLAVPCKIITIVERVNATFTLLSGEIRVSQIGKAVRSIRFDQIGLVSTVRPKHVEVFTSGCDSILVTFSEAHYRSVVDALRKCDIDIITSREDGMQKLFIFWMSGRVSYFQLLVGVNLMSGRSFSDIYAYPMAPVVSDGKFLSDMKPIDNSMYVRALSRLFFTLNMIRSESMPTQTFSEHDELARAAAECQCVPPQFYYSFYSFQQKAHETIYRNRKIIDSDEEIGKQVISWIEHQFNVRVPALNVESKPCDKFSEFHLSQTGNLKCCCFFKLVLDAFFAYWRTGNVAVIYFNNTPSGLIPVTLRKFKEKMVLGDHTIMCPMNSFMLILDTDNCVMYRISDSFPTQKAMMSFSITKACSMGDDVVLVTDHRMIEISPAQTFPLKRRTICTEAQSISAIEASSTFHVIAYATSDGWIKIISVDTAHELGRIYMGSATIEHILITKSWGFVVIKTSDNIITSTIDGVIVSRAPLSRPIEEWCSHTVSGVDYVIFRVVDANTTTVYSFEAFSITPITELHTCPHRTIAMRIAGDRDKFYLISKSGGVTTVPLCL